MTINYESAQNTLLDQLRENGIYDEKVLKAIRATPRHLFVRAQDRSDAYIDLPLSIGYRSAISQPYIVAKMLQLLELEKDHKVLDIGTGSGWNAAIMSLLAREIYTIDINKNILNFAKYNIKKLSKPRKNIKFFQRDGYEGLQEYSTFERIIVSAACPEIPESLLEQLSNNGIIIAPINKSFYLQDIIKLKKIGNTTYEENHGEVTFVPLRTT
jgi:protein-L-isoaspartate(D-aspartate) O-methyltransferase